MEHKDIEIHPSEFVFQKSRGIVSDFCGIQTHEGELCSAPAPIIDSISLTMFFLWLLYKNIENYSHIFRNRGQRLGITTECERNDHLTWSVRWLLMSCRSYIESIGSNGLKPNSPRIFQVLAFEGLRHGRSFGLNTEIVFSRKIIFHNIVIWIIKIRLL